MSGADGLPALSRISDYPFHYAAADPARPALLFEDTVLSYGELAQRVEVCARALHASGVRPGERVAVLSTPRPEFFIICLATARLGGIWLGLNPAHTVEEFTYVLRDASPRLVFTLLSSGGRDYADDIRDAARLAGNPAEVLPLADLRGPDPFLDRAAAADPAEVAAVAAGVASGQPALIVYTSGSTGAPKGALIRHSGLVRLGRVESAQWAVPRPRLICNLPIDHIGGVGDLCCVPLVAGGSIVFQERFDAQRTLDAIACYRVTALFQVPTQLQRIAALPGFAAADLSSLRVVGWGGGPLPAEVIRRYRRLGVALVATYGATEVTSSVTYTAPGADDEVLAHTVGLPDPELDVRLLTDDGRQAGPGETGEVCVRHPSVMVGYYKRPQATAEVFTADGWLRTGDCGQFREDGNLLLVGRRREMFKSGGYNIYPREIELAVESHPAVAVAAVVSRPDADYQAVGVAFVELEPGAAVTADELSAWCRQRLANYKVPKKINIVDRLPLLPVGKINRPMLASAAGTAEFRRVTDRLRRSLVPTFRGVSGRVYYKAWRVPPPRAAAVVFLHGFGEHSGLYHRFGNALNAAGIELWALDEIGHGLTEGDRALIRSIDDLVENGRRLTALAEAAEPGRPAWLAGHSLGAAAAAVSAARDPGRYAGLILSGAALSPLDWVLGLADDDAADLALDPADLSSDPFYLDELTFDPLAFTSAAGTRSLAAVFPPAWAELASDFGQVTLPVLFVHGSDDPVVPVAHARAWSGRLARARLAEFAGARHDILNESVHRDVVSAITEFVLAAGANSSGARPAGIGGRA